MEWAYFILGIVSAKIGDMIYWIFRERFYAKYREKRFLANVSVDHPKAEVNLTTIATSREGAIRLLEKEYNDRQTG